MKTLRETVQEAARDTHLFSVRECDKYAAALLKKLRSLQIHGAIVRLSAPVGRGFIVPKNPALLLPFNVSLEMAIATNGRHWGILVDGHVYEQLLRDGVPLDQWPGYYDCDVHHFNVEVVANFDAE